MNASSKRKDSGMDSVDSMAVSEFKDEVFTFRWDVKNFKERLNNKDPLAKLDSPVFTCGEGNKKLEWNLRLKWSYKKTRDDSTEEDTFLAMFLNLANYKTPIHTNIEFDLLDSEEKSRENRIFFDREFCSATSTRWGWPDFVNIANLLDSKQNLLADETLRLRCRIIIKRNVERHLKPLKGKNEEDALTQKNPMVSVFVTKMFISSLFTDISIKTKRGSTWKAHKAVLSARSPVFMAMFQSQMTESIENIVEIEDFEDHIVKLMLDYIYCVEISQESLSENSVKLFQIADKYDIKELKDLLEEALTLDLCVETVVDTLILADMNGVLDLKARAIKFINTNKEAVMNSEDFHKLLNYNHNPSIFKELFTNKLNQH